MIDKQYVRVACQSCNGETDVIFEDIYGDQYTINHCPLCGSEDIDTHTLEEEDEDV